MVSLTETQINWLLDGYDLALMKGHKTLHYESIFRHLGAPEALFHVPFGLFFDTIRPWKRHLKLNKNKAITVVYQPLNYCL